MKVDRCGVACSIGPPGTIFPMVMTTKATQRNLDSLLRLLKGGDEKMDEPMFLVLTIRHSGTEWRCDQSRRVSPFSATGSRPALVLERSRAQPVQSIHVLSAHS
jgi:hypothetical protein